MHSLDWKVFLLKTLSSFHELGVELLRGLGHLPLGLDLYVKVEVEEDKATAKQAFNAK